MSAQEFKTLKKRIVNEGLDDGARIVREGGPIFDPDKSDWDAEGLNFRLGSTRRKLTDSQYQSLLTAYARALTRGGRNAS